MHSAHAVYIHCTCHRLQLASLQAADSVIAIKKLFGADWCSEVTFTIEKLEKKSMGLLSEEISAHDMVVKLSLTSHYPSFRSLLLCLASIICS